MILNMAGGGGGANFLVKRYATEAALLADAPKDGTLGVITSVPMTTWRMSFADSSSPVEGMVQIRLGTDSNIDFSASKKNYVRVCPLYAKVYSGGEWQDAVLMGRKNGAWVSPWKVFVKGMLAVEPVTLYGKAVFDSDGLTLTSTASSGAFASAYVQMDITNYRRIYVKAYSNFGTAQGQLEAKMGIASAVKDSNAWISYADMKVSSSGTNEYTLDISNKVGTVYVQCHVRGNTSVSSTRTVQIKEWRLER